MKVLFVVQSLKKAGAERMLVNICNELVKDQKFKVAIFLMKMDNEFQDELDNRVILAGGECEIKFSLIRRNIVTNHKYIEFIHKFKPDIIHSHLFHADIFAHTYYYKDAVYVSHLQNSIVEEYNGFLFKRIFKKPMWTNLYEYSWIYSKYKKFKTNFIACSAGAYKLHNDRLGIGEVKIIPNASPLPKNLEPRTSVSRIVKMIWVGRFTDVKRPQLAIQIAKLLRYKDIPFHLKMIGTGLELDNCKELIHKEGLAKNVQLCGLMNNMDSIYKNADLLIHTSVYEGLPLVFAEANSYGIPIVTTNCMPDNDFIVHKKNGLIIKTDSPTDFVDGICDIIENSVLYAELSKNAIEHSKKFGMENYIQSLLDFYHSMLEKKK